MRQDQFEKLQSLGEKLMDVFLDEAEPEHWPGHGVRTSAMDAQTRGDRYWVKKNAAATGVLYAKVETLIGTTQMRGLGTSPSTTPDGEPEDSQLDADIARAEKEAERLMRELQGGPAKAAFNKRVHGRP